MEGCDVCSVIMSGYGQPKRQKVRESRDVDWFQGIDKIEYNSAAAPGDAAYRYYSGAERVHARPADDWLKFSLSLTHFRSYTSLLRPRPWDDSPDGCKRCLRSFFELLSRLGLRYWTALDSDILPAGEEGSWDEMLDYVLEMMQRFHVKLLWLAPDLHSHYRYTSGAITSSEATTFTQAATQIKKCLEVSQRLSAECFLIWPYREGYNNVFQTDVAKEIKLFAKLLKIIADYKEKLGLRCQMLIMPYYKSFANGDRSKRLERYDMVNMYMWDVTSCLFVLKQYNLERFYKVCAPPGHHMYMANVYNMLGGVTISNNVDHYDTKRLTLMMKCILDQGSAPPGGITLQLFPRQTSDLRELLITHVKYIDAIAKGLKHAAALITEQVFSKYLQQRYSTFHSGFGSRIIANDVSMEECEDYYKKNHTIQTDNTGKCEHLELTFQRYLDSTDHL